MSILGWIVLGLIAGFIASWIVNKRGMGCLLNVVFGIIAVILLARMGKETGSSRGDFREVIDNLRFRFRRNRARRFAQGSVPRAGES